MRGGVPVTTASMAIVLPAVVLSLSAAASGAVVAPPRPPQGTFVVDGADVLDAGQEAALNAVSSSLWRDRKVELHVVTIPSLESQGAAHYTVKSFAYYIFNQWGIGSQEKNDGILILFSPGDRKCRIELGWDWGVAYDPEAERIMNEAMVPAFKAGDAGRGLLAGARELSAMARADSAPAAERAWDWRKASLPFFPDWESPWAWAVYLGLPLFVAMTMNWWRTGPQGWGYAGFSFIGWVTIAVLYLPFMFVKLLAKPYPCCGGTFSHRFNCSNGDSWSGGDGGWGSCGSSGGGSGGGSSGGGGATGSW